MTWSWEKTREPTVTSSTSSCGRHRLGGGDRSTASILSAGIQTSQLFTIKLGHADPPHQLVPNLQYISAVKETHERLHICLCPRVHLPWGHLAPEEMTQGPRQKRGRRPETRLCTSVLPALCQWCRRKGYGPHASATALMPALQNTESRSSLGPRPAQTLTGDSQLRGPLLLPPKGGGRHKPSVLSGLGCFQVRLKA